MTGVDSFFLCYTLIYLFPRRLPSPSSSLFQFYPIQEKDLAFGHSENYSLLIQIQFHMPNQKAAILYLR